MNALGNWSLLDKSFNISKSDEPMWNFLQEVHEFKQGKFTRQEWQAALSLSDAMTSPDGVSLADLKNMIQTRDVFIRNELKEFINGTKQRVDVIS